jgi:hypothetical protein
MICQFVALRGVLINLIRVIHGRKKREENFRSSLRRWEAKSGAGKRSEMHLGNDAESKT